MSEMENKHTINIPHLYPDCNCAGRVEDFLVRGVTYRVFLPDCDRGFYGSDGPIATMAEVVEEVSGYRLIHRNVVCDWLRPYVDPRLWKTETMVKFLALTPAYASPYSKYYVCRDILEILRPYPRCFICKQRVWNDGPSTLTGYNEIIRQHPHHINEKNHCLVLVCPGKCLEVYHQQVEEFVQWHRQEKECLAGCKKQLKALRQFLKKNDREALASLPQGFGPVETSRS